MRNPFRVMLISFNLDSKHTDFIPPPPPPTPYYVGSYMHNIMRPFRTMLIFISLQRICAMGIVFLLYQACDNNQKRTDQFFRWKLVNINF